MKTKSDIYAICHCSNYDFPAMRDHFIKQHNASSYRNVLQINWLEGEAFIFDYGIAVFWNITPQERKSLLNKLSDFAQGPMEKLLDDEFTYELKTENLSLKNDHIRLDDDDILTRLAVSHGIAQSTKLGQFEARVEKTITSTKYIPENIATTGKSGLKRKELARMRGFLYLTKSDVMLHYDLLDVPEFFWEYPELQSYFTLLADYLEVRPRIEVLNKKLETIRDLLDMIADEQNHAHSSLLEWIIIWLIASEMIILVIQEFIH